MCVFFFFLLLTKSESGNAQLRRNLNCRDFRNGIKPLLMQQDLLRYSPKSNVSILFQSRMCDNAIKNLITQNKRYIHYASIQLRNNCREVTCFFWHQD